MFIGHYGPAFALKRAAPRVPLWLLFASVQLLDILISGFLRLGIERMRIQPGRLGASDLDLYHIPWSHGLPAAIAWSLAAGAAYRWAARERGWTGAAAVGTAVFSHWITDFLVHPPDLPLWGAGARVGLGLWQFGAISLSLEIGLFLAGFGLYLSGTRARDWRGIAFPWLFACALTAVHVIGHSSAESRPRDFDSVTLFGLTVFPVIALIAWLVERTREPHAALQEVAGRAQA